jgi:hypothetical protein
MATVLAAVGSGVLATVLSLLLANGSSTASTASTSTSSSTGSSSSSSDTGDSADSTTQSNGDELQAPAQMPVESFGSSHGSSGGS